MTASITTLSTEKLMSPMIALTTVTMTIAFQAHGVSSSFITAAGLQTSLAPYFQKFLLNCDQWDGYNAETFDAFSLMVADGDLNILRILSGATTIIAVDITPSRLDLARELGATHVINSRETDPVAAVRDITGGGADYTLECSGRDEVLRQAIDSLGVLGACGIVGAPREGTEAAFNVNEVMIPGRRIVGRFALRLVHTQHAPA